MKIQFTNDMKEISGFGLESGYEQACRAMVVKGAEWLAKHPDADLKVKSFKGIYGVTDSQSPDAKKLEKVFTSVSDDLTGAMVQATWSHLFYIKSHGWDNYVKKMKEERSKE